MARVTVSVRQAGFCSMAFRCTDAAGNRGDWRLDTRPCVCLASLRQSVSSVSLWKPLPRFPVERPSSQDLGRFYLALRSYVCKDPSYKPRRRRRNSEFDGTRFRDNARSLLRPWYNAVQVGHASVCHYPRAPGDGRESSNSRCIAQEFFCVRGLLVSASCTGQPACSRFQITPSWMRTARDHSLID